MPRTITGVQVEEVVVRTLEETPDGATHWSRRELARQVGISPASVHRPGGRSGAADECDLRAPRRDPAP
jgi:hypothetical protein